MAANPTDVRDARLNLRVPSRLKAEFEEEARSRSKSLSAFVLDVLSAEVQRGRSERTTFFVDGARWGAFQAALDRPAMDKPRLRALLESPGVFDG